MKKILFLLAICLSSTAFSQVPNYVPSNGLIGYWPFNGNANDKSLSGNDGTVNGATLTADRFGNSNAAYSFDGTDDYISLPTSNDWNFGVSDFTISSWFKTISSQNGNIIRYDDGSGPQSLWGVRVFNSELNFLLNGFGNSSPTLYSTTNLGGSILDNTWHHVIAIRRNSQMEIYIDGFLEASFTYPVVDINASGFFPSIGRLGSYAYEFFNGSLDDIGIWNRALTQQEITNLYNATASSTCIDVSPSADTLCAGESTTLTASFSDSRWQNYYFEDFESGVSSEWTSSSTFSYEGSQLLGRYGNNNIALNLSNLPAHDSVRVEFDLFIGDTWDGYSLLGGSRDIWRLRFNGDTIINATFAACCGSAGVGNGGQSYPDNIPAVNPATTGAFALDLPDFVGSGDGTDLYKVSRSSADTSSSLTVEFSAQDLQGLSDESWALDNVRVYLYSDNVLNDVLWSTGDTTLSITVSPSATTTYYATLDDGLSLCLDSAVVEVSSLSVDLGADTISLCDTATTLDAGSGYGSYLWSTGEMTQTIDVDSSGMYSVTVHNDVACSVSDSAYVDLFQAEVAQEDTTICSGETIQLFVNHTGISQNLNPNISYSSISDLDGNVYAVVTIGNQVWMAENLRTITYSNGDPIPQVQNNIDWGAINYGAWCIGGHPAAEWESDYGKFYNHMAVGDSRNICPSGWHVPLLSDWDTLVNVLGGDPSVIGGELKSTGTLLWSSPNVGATNSSGFSGVPAGLRTGFFGAVNTVGTGTDACWWAADIPTINGQQPSYKGLRFSNTSITTQGRTGRAGMSVRCVKDDTTSQITNDIQYLWSNGSTESRIAVSPTENTTYTVTITNGISSCTDSVTVTVSNQPPIITCLTDISTTSSTDGTGDCFTTVVIGNPGVSDDCDMPVLTAEINGSVIDVNTYAFPVGTTTITWIATDGQGLADTCYQDITVIDDEDPVLISCPLGIQVDNDLGDCGAIVTFVEPVFSDNCSFQVNSPALGSGSFFPVGLTNLTYTAIDPSGNQESCTIAVIVDDVERPVFLECPGDTTISTDALSCSASFSFPSAIVSDNCPNTALQQLGLPSGANFPLGSSVVTFIVNDTSGNRDTCSFTVTVVDSVAPYFTSCPSDINIELGTQSCDTVVSWSSLSAFDNCSATITQINGLPSGSVFPVGSTLNRFVVADNAGNTDTCSFTVTVTDNKPPVIVCPPPTIVNNVGSNCGPQVINYSLPTSTDNCVTVTTTRIAGPASGSVFPVGTTTVTYVATDNVGNTDTCSFTVTINDPLPPPASVDTINGPIEMCKNTGSFYSVNAASNATDYFWTVIGGDINLLAVGTTSRNKQITWQTSGIGMIIVEAVNTCYGSTPDTLEVMVYDNPSPVDAGLDSTTLCSPLSSYTLQATPPAIGNGVWSVVLGGGTIVSPNSPTSLVTGLSADSNLFRWTVTNAICTRTDSIYIIPDIEAPTATCQDITRYLPPAGFINVNLSEVVLSTADNCAVDSVWLVQSVFTCVDLGGATAEVIVSDSFGNFGGCTANITLIDTIKPTAICQDITVVLNSLGEYTLNAQEVNGGSFDNCSLDSVYIDRSFFTCADTGIHQVMLTVVDLSGYRDSCIANVTVLDTAGPAINGCVNRTVFLDSNGLVVVDPNTLFLSIPNDPCGLASITTNVNQNIFTCEDAGPNTVVVTATDNNGNQSTCSSTVTVVDNIAPLAVCSDINVTLDSSGSYTILDANVFDAGSYDACGITTWIASPTTFTCSDTGSNIVTVTIYDSLGNTSTCTPSVNVSSNFSSTLDTTVCGGIVWNGSYYDSPGTYTYNTSSVTGCDSVALLNLTLYPAFTVSDSARGCDSVVVNGNVYFSSQVVVDSFLTADGCDSIVTTDVIIDPTRYGVDVKAICNSYTWVDGQTYTASTNTPTFTYTGANGCDSIVTLNLTILNSTTDSVSATACDSFTWNGTTYYQSGGYTYQTQNAVGCDSTATLLLTINSPTSSQESVTACDSFIWNGVIYQQSGTYTYQTQNTNGCDSIATLVLTIYNSTSSQESVTACDSYQWNGGVYTQSGNYTYQTQNAAGCDSTVFLNLTINYSTSSQESVTACDSYTWNGVTYQQSGTYTYQTQNAVGCDSTATLNLTINSSNSGVEVVSACESYTWIDGNTYLSDTFGPTFTLSNASGCDSVVTLDLTIRNASSSIDTVTYCGVYTWLDSNQYSTDTFGPTVTYTNADGCDSIVTLFLTIEPLNTVIEVTQAFTLTAQQDNGTYQWIDCNNHNAPILGETNQSYSPVETGLYAVIITANGCTDTSACVSQQGSGVGILESTLLSEVYLYPNPFADELHLDLGQYYGSIRLVVYDMVGQTIYSQQYNGVDRIDPTMDVAAGTYTLRLEDDKGRYAMFRIARKR